MPKRIWTGAGEGNMSVPIPDKPLFRVSNSSAFKAKFNKLSRKYWDHKHIIEPKAAASVVLYITFIKWGSVKEATINTQLKEYYNAWI